MLYYQFTLTFLCFLFLNATIVAQTTSTSILAELQANPAILWIGEVEVDYIPKYGSSTESEVSKALLHQWFGVYIDAYQLLKSTNQNEQGVRKRASQLIVALVDAAPSLEAYADAELTQKLTPKAIQQRLEIRDTFLVVEGEELNLDRTEALSINVRKRNPLTTIKGIRTKQLLYYHREKLAFETKILAYAPLIVHVEWGSWRLKEKQPAFWLKPKNLTIRPDWKQPSITWAQQFYTHFDPKKTIVRKATQLLTQAINNSISAFKAQEKAIYIGGPSYKQAATEITAYDWSELDSFSTDTIIRFDPETFKEIVEIKQEKFAGRVIERLLLLQEFYWDDEKRQLGVYPLGFGYVNRITNQTYFIRQPFKDKRHPRKESKKD